MAQPVTRNLAARPGPVVVVSAGRMQNTVKVRQVKETWHKHLRKTFYRPKQFLVHDPNSSLLEGDVITTAPERHSKWVKQTVAAIVAPFGKPIDERPPLYTAQQRAEIADTKRKAKVQRRASRGVASAIREARERGWEVETPTVGGWGALHDEAQSAGGAPKPDRPKDAMGRSVLPGGRHKFGGKGEGGVNKEAAHGAARTSTRLNKAREQEAEREETANQSTEEVAKANLQGKQ
ncbi:MAG: hypothetical protein Q9162_004315 [Coniocarpon cinnabarinum]